MTNIYYHNYILPLYQICIYRLIQCISNKPLTEGVATSSSIHQPIKQQFYIVGKGMNSSSLGLRKYTSHDDEDGQNSP